MTRAKAATVVDIAAYLGVRPSTVRKWAKKHGIEPTGRRWKADLYDPNPFIEQFGGPRKLRKGWKKPGPVV